MNKYIEKLINLSDDIFYEGLSQLPYADELKGEAGAVFVVSFALEMMKHVDLAARIQAQRLGAVIGKLDLDSSGISKLALLAQQLSPGLKNTIAAFLKPSQRRILSGSEEDRLRISLIHDESEKESDIKPATFDKIAMDTILEPKRAYSTVILLSKIANQDSNKQLLEKNGFSPLFLDSMDKLRQDLKSNDDVCACLVDSSFIKEMEESEQCQFIEELSAYSTFIWLRIDDSGLLITHDQVRDILKKARCQLTVEAKDLSIQANSTLRQKEIAELRRAQEILQIHQEIQIIPGELSEEQSRILIAAAREHARELKYMGEPIILKLITQFLPGGRSDAKIASVGLTPEGQYVVAKIDKKINVINEIKRFRLFIQRWDNKLQPKASFHGQAAVILFGLVSDGVNSQLPAPMLEKCLEDLWINEMFELCDSNTLELDEKNIGSGLKNMTTALFDLNRRIPEMSEFQPVNLGMDYFKKLETKSITWGFDQMHRNARDKAEEKYKTRAGFAIVHGDLQLRNILVQNNLNMHLIDYAGSGPGHPAIDLVRLELALYIGCFKQLEDESQYIKLQEELSIKMSDYDKLKRDFPESFRTSINRVCMRGCIAARDNAIEAAKSHGGAQEDYLAAKYLVAWQNLSMEGRQASLARSVISALAPMIDRW